MARGPVIGVWAAVAAVWLARRRRIPSVSLRGYRITLQDAALAGIALATLVLGVLSPPRHADSLTYHVPRILHWIQNGTLDPYPTNIDRQIWIGAGAEYFLLHLRLLAGTDRVLTLVQWLSFIGLAPVVSLIARELGASSAGQRFAALFALTLPMAITQATGAQVDVFASLWLCTSVALLLRIRRNGLAGTSIVDAVALGGAIGIAVLGKAINALYLTPFLVWISVAAVRRRHLGRYLALAGIAATTATALNAGHIYRNVIVWDNPLGIPERYGLANEVISPQAVASNVIRNVALHAGTRFQAVNAMMENGVSRFHDLIGIGIHDRRTTFRKTSFAIPLKVEDEGLSGNRWHLILILAAIAFAAGARARPALLFLGCVVGGGVLFAAYLKWQPWHSRLHLPLFAVAAGAVAVALERSLSPRKLALTGRFLIVFAMLPVFRNASIPVLTRQPFFTMSYESRLFALGGWGSEGFTRSADLIASRGCAKVGLAIGLSTPEYPIWKLMEWRMPGRTVEIRHVAAKNETRHSASDRDSAFTPCAVIYADKANETSPLMPAGYTKAREWGEVSVWLPD